MKRFTRVIIILVLAAVPLLSPAMAAADDTTTSGVSSAPSTSSDEESVKLDEVKADDSTISTRIANRKKNLAALSTVVKARLTLKCEAAQVKLKTLRTLNETVALRRLKIHSHWLTNVQAIITKAEASGLDTTALKADLATLKTKNETLKAAVTDYRQALADLAGMSCKGDVEGFQASLDAARTAQSTVLAASKDIRTFVTGTLKPDLIELKAAIKSSES